MSCPTNQTLQQLLDDRLSPDEECGLEEHIETCAVCQRTLERLTSVGDDQEDYSKRNEDFRSPSDDITAVDSPAHPGETPSPPRLSDRQLAQLTPLLSSSNPGEANRQTLQQACDPHWPIIAGYEILAKIGQGGMGTVYRARDLRLGRQVAIKRLNHTGKDSPDDLIRFLAESQTIARLEHPNIVRLLEFGSHEQSPYCVLEYIDGGSLENRLSGSPWSAEEAARLIETVARAMDYAHSRGVIHRDLKPGNILLPRNSDYPRFADAKVADFGLAKQVHSDLSLTMTGTLAGTPSYMAPEQVRGEKENIRPATDVYSLGAVLYELLTGRTPFSGVTQLEVMNQIVEDDPLPPSRLVPQLPRDLESICLQCLAKQPARRYNSAAALAEDLHRFRNGQPVAARSSGFFDRGLKWTRRKPALAALVTMIFLVAVVGFPGIMLLWLDAASSRDQAQRNESSQRWAQYRANMAAAGSFLQLYNANAARRALDAAPPEHRNWEWRHFRRRLESARIVLSGHKGNVWSARFSPNGQRVASFSTDGTVRLWDAESGRLVAVLPSHKNTDRRARACFSPDGELLAAPGPDRTVRLHDARTGRSLATLSGHTADVMEVVFSPDGKTLLSRPVYGEDKTIRLWDVHAHTLLKTWELPAPAFWIAFSPDGNTMAATTAHGKIRLWHGDSQKVVQNQHGRDVMLTAAAFSPDGRRVVSSQGEYVEFALRISRVSDGEQIASMTGHKNAVHAVRISPDGSTIASASDDQTVRLWDATDGRALDVLVGHRGPVSDVQFSPDGHQLASVSRDHTVRIWDAVKGTLRNVLFGHTEGVNSLEFDPTGNRIVTASSDRTVCIWDLQKSSSTSIFRGHTSYVYDVAYSYDGQHAASASWDGTFQIWNVATGDELMRLETGLPNIAISLSFNRSGTRLATLERGAVRVWDVATGACLQHQAVSGPPDSRLVFSHDDALIVLGLSSGEIGWWEVPGNRISATAAHEGGCRDVALSPDSRLLASAGSDGVAFVWSMASKTRIAELNGHSRPISSVTFNAAGTLLATGSEDGSVRLWDANDYSLIGVLPHGTKVYDVAFHPDGERLATACADNSVRIWDVTTVDHVAELNGHEAYVHAVAFSPDGSQLLSASGDSTVRIWSAKQTDGP